MGVRWHLAWFRFTFPYDAKHRSCIYWPFLYFFGEMPIQILCPFFNCAVCFTDVVKLQEFLIYSGYDPLLDM